MGKSGGGPDGEGGDRGLGPATDCLPVKSGESTACALLSKKWDQRWPDQTERLDI